MMKSDSLVVQLDARSKFLILLRLSRLEYLTSTLLIAVPVYLASGEFHWPALLAVVIPCLIHQPAVSLINHYTDRAEDRINIPERVKLCETVGYRNVRNVGLALSALHALWTLVFVYVANLTVALIHLFGALMAFNYSWGLRFKRHFVLVAIPYVLSPLLHFMLAWAISHPLHTLPPVVLVLGYEAVVLFRSIKNLPDALGDRQAGVRTLFATSPRITGLTPFIWFSTHILVVLLVLLGVLEPKYLITFITLPMTIYGAWWMRRVRSAKEKENLFRYASFYSKISKATLLLIFAPTVPVLLAIVAIIAYTYVVSYLMDREHFSFVRLYTR